MKKIEVVSEYSEEFNKDINVLEVDGEIFDWGLDSASWAEAKKVISQHPELAETVTTSIVNHFCECFGEFVGRDITLEEVSEAIKRGYIE